MRTDAKDGHVSIKLQDLKWRPLLNRLKSRRYPSFEAVISASLEIATPILLENKGIPGPRLELVRVEVPKGFAGFIPLTFGSAQVRAEFEKTHSAEWIVLSVHREKKETA